MSSTDSRFWIGEHDICEDYALASELVIVDENGIKRRPYAIISDGCSSSGLPIKHAETNIGSLVLSHAAKQFIGNFEDKDWFKDCVLSKCKAIGHSLECVPEVMDATLGVITQIDDTIYGRIYGDGIFALINKELIYIILCEYDNGNAPYYLNYNNDEARDIRFKKNFGLNKKVTEIWINRNGGEIKIETNTGYENDGLPFILMSIADGWDAAIIMSDGPQSYIRKEGRLDQLIPVEKVLSLLLNFKNYNGDFIKRRVNAFQKQCNKYGWRNLDDMAVAGFATIL